MSCMTHQCRSCGHEWFNNRPRDVCPRCYSANVSHDWDESPDHDNDWDTDDEETIDF